MDGMQLSWLGGYETLGPRDIKQLHASSAWLRATVLDSSPDCRSRNGRSSASVGGFVQRSGAGQHGSPAEARTNDTVNAETDRFKHSYQPDIDGPACQ